MFMLYNPDLTAFQLVPLLVVRKTPPPPVPTKTFVPEVAKDATAAASGPFV
jgi:hypothetical protein